MDLVFDFNEAQDYHRWQQKPRNRLTIERENRLMMQLLAPHKGERVLDIGCGSGVRMRPFLDHGMRVTGLDPSPYMLDIALADFGTRVELYRGYANNLPFEDNAFNHACLNNTLEFLADPHRALQEACRVAKDKIYIGVLNRFSATCMQRRIRGIFTSSIFNRARFYSIWEIKAMMRALLGEVPVYWRTTCLLSSGQNKLIRRIENSFIAQRNPVGAYLGFTAVVIPRFRTRPLAIKYTANRAPDPAAG